MTSTQTRPPTRPLPPNRPSRRRLPSFGLSATQLIATALAAITATFAASYLGVTGTVIGAALASVTTAVGNAVYGQSLRRTSERVRDVVPATRLNPRLRTSALPVVETSAGDHDDDEARPELPAAAPSPRPRPRAAVLWRRIALGAVATFVAIVAVLTCVEAVAGRPVSDLVRGDRGSGTSVFGHVTVRTSTVPARPTVTVTVTPKVVITTPTVTQTAPATTLGGAGGAATSPGASSSAGQPSVDAPSSAAPTGSPSAP